MNNKNIKAPYMASICFIMDNLPKDRNACRALLNSLEQACPPASIAGDDGKNRFIIQFYVIVYREWQGMSLSGLAFVAVNELFERINKGYPDFDFFEHANLEAVVNILDPENSKIEGHNVNMADFLSRNEFPCNNDFVICDYSKQ